MSTDLLKALEVDSIENFDQDYVLIEHIGQGSFGAVYKARHNLTNTNTAIKSIRVNSEELEEITKEISIMKGCDSNYVVKYYGYFFKDKVLWIIMEYCGLGSCREILNRRNVPFTEAQAAIILTDSLRGLAYLHSQQKVHRDIKADNILMNEQGDCKIADFGVSGVGQKMKTVIGTPLFLAPEVIVNDGFYDCKVDVWSLGITAIELIDFYPPNYHEDPMRVLFNMPNQPPPTLKDPSKYSRAMSHFIAQCLIKDPEKRSGAEELLTHPWIAWQSQQDRSALNEVIDDMKQKKKKNTQRPEQHDELSATPAPSKPTPPLNELPPRSPRKRSSSKSPRKSVKLHSSSSTSSSEDKDKQRTSHTSEFSTDDQIEKELQEYREMLQKNIELQLEEKKKQLKKKQEKEKMNQAKEEEVSTRVELRDSLARWNEVVESQKSEEERKERERKERKERRERRKSRSHADLKPIQDLVADEIKLKKYSVDDLEHKPKRDGEKKKKDKKYQTMNDKGSRGSSKKKESGIGKTLKQIMDEETRAMEEAIEAAARKREEEREKEAAIVVKKSKEAKISTLSKFFGRSNRPSKAELEQKGILRSENATEEQKAKKETLQNLLEHRQSESALQQRGIIKSPSDDGQKKQKRRSLLVKVL